MRVKLGLLGWPVGHSLSPRIFSTLGEELGVDLSYRAIPIAASELAGELDSLHADGYAGVNVTIPHKQAALAFLDSLTPEAKAIGAVNTISFSGAKSKGHNTDAQGFLDALAAGGFHTDGIDAVVYGAGGAARAAAWALGEAGAKSVRICARRGEQAKKLATDLKKLFRSTEFSAGPSRDADLWVNATPLGMEGFPDESPAGRGKSRMAFDLVYGRETAFLGQAREAGAKTLDGLSMLVFQALRGWEFWFKPLGKTREQLAAMILRELK